ncbi:SPOR domain-containing protein [Thioalkalivibrio paradoxus]|uniref:Sporulation protein n=1 Tax=Thioalkalivibrio paradoxus ARh 1 TaxID=713585 RepID=W0DJS5_9GAMM|nr:SPOR domain-containing protein [Thioalkalivibrio paradoxus]AHE97233.1 sporulation protein [Thioalkalivibrio paradoxus ARh 1]
MAQARKVRRRPAPQHGSRPIPGWVWLLAGMLVGLAVAAVFYLQGADRMGQDPGWLTHGETAAPAPPAQEPRPEPIPQDRTRFQFYELLPQDEVRVPPPPAPATPRAATPEPAPTPESRPEPQGRVLLQTGSFRRYAQADEMKARLAMMGLQANIREVQVNGQTFHRVYLGPFDSDAQVNRTLERLRRENIEALRLPASG